MEQRIAAYATPPGSSGLAVLRIAGEGSAALADRIFAFGPLPDTEGYRADSERTVVGLDGYQAAFGYVHEPDSPAKALDQCIVTRFRKPYSYTGEEQVEISIHGSAAVRRILLDCVLAAGARPAEPGEFSKWAFMNGKMDLAQAEAVMELIQADTNRQQQAALQQMQGVTSDWLADVRDLIYQLIAILEVDIEYPEYEDFGNTREEITNSFESIIQTLSNLASRNQQGRILRDGLRVVLVGEPNVGKSSVLNALAGEERAIVTEIAGTTRDIIELRLDMAGIPVMLYDTAGLRDSEDTVEKIGVDRTIKMRSEADLLMAVVSAEELAETLQLIPRLIGESNQPFLLLCNKIDKLQNVDQSSEWLEVKSKIRESYPNCVAQILISASKSWGIAELKQAISSFYEELGGRGGADFVLTSARQQHLLDQALTLFRQLQSDLITLPNDILASGIRQGMELLAEMTGEDVSEQMIEEIFSRFCIGK